MVVMLMALGGIIQNWDASGRVAKWATELMGHHITYIPNMAIKSQVLADFFTGRRRPKPRRPQAASSTGSCTSMA
jgi:hypothetical protein